VRVAILGAGGTIAPLIVGDLAESAEVESMLLLDLDVERARTVADRYGGGKVADVRNGLDLDGCEVLVNSASYRVNLDAMRACLRAGAHYIDLGGLYWMTGRQLELHDEFERAGLLALIGMGSSPGKTNVMAAAAARELGGRLDEAHVYAAGRNLDPDAPLAAPYAIQTLKDELEMPPVCIRNGEPVEVEPMTPAGERDFGDPVGCGQLIHTIHSEMRTFPESFGVKEATFNLSLAPAVLEHLYEIEATVPPDAPTVSVHIVDCVRDGRTVTMRAVTQGSVRSTAAPAAAAVRLIDRIDARGVLPPERCVDPDDLFPELEQKGCVFT
jgi:saccharopine dehydrogenase-like NADP-dependent oxidoreductase